MVRRGWKPRLWRSGATRCRSSAAPFTVRAGMPRVRMTARTATGSATRPAICMIELTDDYRDMIWRFANVAKSCHRRGRPSRRHRFEPDGRRSERRWRRGSIGDRPPRSRRRARPSSSRGNGASTVRCCKSNAFATASHPGLFFDPSQLRKWRLKCKAVADSLVGEGAPWPRWAAQATGTETGSSPSPGSIRHNGRRRGPPIPLTADLLCKSPVGQ